jgi:hypothetical protein
MGPVDVIMKTRRKTDAGFEALTAASTKMTVFWVVTPCSLLEVYQRFRGYSPDDRGSKYL